MNIHYNFSFYLQIFTPNLSKKSDLLINSLLLKFSFNLTHTHSHMHAYIHTHTCTYTSHAHTHILDGSTKPYKLLYNRDCSIYFKK